MTGEHPVLQLLGVKTVGEGAKTRYRLVVSDGQCVHKLAMLSTQLNHMILNGEIPKPAHYARAYEENTGKNEDNVMIEHQHEIAVRPLEIAVADVVVVQPILQRNAHQHATDICTTQHLKKSIWLPVYSEHELNRLGVFVKT